METHAAKIQAFAASREESARQGGRLNTRDVVAMIHCQVEALLFTEGSLALRKSSRSYLDSLGDGIPAESMRGRRAQRGPIIEQAGRTT